MADLVDRVMLITGATGVLGTAVTHAFARTQARVALAGRSRQKLEQLAGASGLPGERTLAVVSDVTQVDDVQQLVDAVMARFGRIDGLINTVGGWSGGKAVWETLVGEWENMLALNLHSAFLLSRATLPLMLDAGWGRIVHVSSKAAVEPRSKRAAYAVAKMGLVTLTEAIAADVKGSGVTANVIVPSVIDTPDNRAAMPKANPEKWVPAEHIAAVIQFLCSDAGSSINGASIPIYGAV
jgi:NAD(P)-dependent dehydrogenase (short-subunit alcohol dehydrogenase family)